MLQEYMKQKIEDSYNILRLAAEMSKEYYQKPLIITYSGGKDSDVMLQLAIECLQPPDFEVLNSHTTVDAPETVYYIRDKFKELESKGIKATIQYPHDKQGNPISMWSLIPEKQMPPTRLARYCCEFLKETTTPNRFIAVGVRESESTGRRGRDIFATRGMRKQDAYYYYYYSHIKEVYEDDKARRQHGGISPNTEGAYDCRFITKAKRKEDLICNPIYKWTDSEIWEYIEDRNMKHNPLYDKGFRRVGCIGCPLASKDQIKGLQLYPKYKENYIKAFDRMLKKRLADGKENKSKYEWTDGEAVYRWWIMDDTIPGQMTIDDFLNEEGED